MLTEYKLMQTLIKLTNLSKQGEGSTIKELVENLISYEGNDQQTIRDTLKLGESVSLEDLHAKLSEEENIELLQASFLSLVTNSDHLTSKKVSSIQAYFNLSEDEAKLFYLLSLTLVGFERLYYKDFFSKKFEYQYYLSYLLEQTFKLPQSFIHEQLFSPDSNLSRFRLIVFNDESLRLSFHIQRYLTQPVFVDFEDFVFPRLPSGPVNFTLSSQMRKDVGEVADFLKTNSSYRLVLLSRSSALSLTLAQEMAQKSNLKLRHLELYPDSKNWEMDTQTIRKLGFHKFEGRLLFLDLRFPIDRYSSANIIITILEKLFENPSLKVIISFDPVQDSSAIFHGLIHRSDKTISITDSDRETRESVYSSRLSGERLDERYYRIPMEMNHLERISQMQFDRTALEKQIDFFSGREPGKENGAFKSSINYEFFNTDLSVNEFKFAVARFVDLDEETRRVIDRTAFLLSGPPGTGKSLLAESVCRDLGLTYRKVRLSDFASMYIHETERKTREFFQENSSYQALIFDEFDSLTLKRENSQRHHEVTEVNEFLNCMDEFRGVIFATTNHPELIDPAAIRRFDFKVRLDYLKADSAVAMFFSLFEKLHFTTFEEKQIQERFKYFKNLTPAILKNIHRQCVLLGDSNVESILTRMDSYLRSYKEGIKLVKS